jgi:hypothetical protein
MVRDALEIRRKRGGTQTNFVCGIVEAPSQTAPRGQVILFWLGDSKLLTWRQTIQTTELLGATWDKREAWSSLLGVVGEIHVFAGDLSQMNCLMAHSDGVDPIRTKLTPRISQVVLNGSLNSLRDLPSSDDISFLEIRFSHRGYPDVQSLPTLIARLGASLDKPANRLRLAPQMEAPVTTNVTPALTAAEPSVPADKQKPISPPVAIPEITPAFANGAPAGSLKQKSRSKGLPKPRRIPPRVRYLAAGLIPLFGVCLGLILLFKSLSAGPDYQPIEKTAPAVIPLERSTVTPMLTPTFTESFMAIPSPTLVVTLTPVISVTATLTPTMTLLPTELQTVTGTPSQTPAQTLTGTLPFPFQSTPNSQPTSPAAGTGVPDLDPASQTPTAAPNLAGRRLQPSAPLLYFTEN